MTIVAYKNAFSELSVLINQMTKENRSKISEKFIEYIELNKNTEYIPENISLYDRASLKRETKIMLSIMYRNYFISKEEKLKRSISDSEILKNIYSYENIFDKDIPKENTVEVKEIIESEEPEKQQLKIITKFDIIKNKILEILRRILKK